MRLSWTVARELGPQVSCPAPFPLWTPVSPCPDGGSGPLAVPLPCLGACACVSMLMCAGAHVEMRTQPWVFFLKLSASFMRQHLSQFVWEAPWSLTSSTTGPYSKAHRPQAACEHCLCFPASAVKTPALALTECPVYSNLRASALVQLCLSCRLNECRQMCQRGNLSSWPDHLQTEVAGKHFWNFYLGLASHFLNWYFLPKALGGRLTCCYVVQDGTGPRLQDAALQGRAVDVEAVDIVVDGVMEEDSHVTGD